MQPTLFCLLAVAFGFALSARINATASTEWARFALGWFLLFVLVLRAPLGLTGDVTAHAGFQRSVAVVAGAFAGVLMTLPFTLIPEREWPLTSRVAARFASLTVFLLALDDISDTWVLDFLALIIVLGACIGALLVPPEWSRRKRTYGALALGLVWFAFTLCVVSWTPAWTFGFVFLGTWAAFERWGERGIAAWRAQPSHPTSAEGRRPPIPPD